MSQLTMARPQSALIDEPACPAAASVTATVPPFAVVSTAAAWSGRVMSAVPATFLLLDAAMKLAKPAPVVEATVSLG